MRRLGCNPSARSWRFWRWDCVPACVTLIAVLLIGGNVFAAADENSGMTEQRILDGLGSAYLPYKSCIDGKLRASHKSRDAIYSELAASRTLPDSPSREQVKALVESQEHWDPHVDSASPEQAEIYKVFRLNRQVTASSILAGAPSVHCGQAPELRRWIQQADDLEAYLRLATMYAPFSACTNKDMQSASNLPDVLAKAGKLPELRRLAIQYLGASNSYVVLSEKTDTTDALRIQAIGAGLALDFAKHMGSDPLRIKLARLMADISFHQIVASALPAKCAPSPELASAIEFVSRRKVLE